MKCWFKWLTRLALPSLLGWYVNTALPSKTEMDHLPKNQHFRYASALLRAFKLRTPIWFWKLPSWPHGTDQKWWKGFQQRQSQRLKSKVGIIPLGKIRIVDAEKSIQTLNLELNQIWKPLQKAAFFITNPDKIMQRSKVGFMFQPSTMSYNLHPGYYIPEVRLMYHPSCGLQFIK